MRDRASVNTVAARTLNSVFPQILDIGCFSHTLDHVGEQMNTPVPDKFIKGWIQIFSRSPKTKLAWKTSTNLPVPSYSTTRWWLKWEVIAQLLKSFDNVDAFLRNSDLPPSKLKLQEIIDPPNNRKLQMEIAITVDAMEPFVKATYNLEGDGPLLFKAYEEISALTVCTSVKHYPNSKAVVNNLGLLLLNNNCCLTMLRIVLSLHTTISNRSLRSNSSHWLKLSSMLDFLTPL